jgi:hypothetical protein
MTIYQAINLQKLLDTKLYDIDLKDNEVWVTDMRGEWRDLQRVILKISIVNERN